jgi:hypothetical protein
MGVRPTLHMRHVEEEKEQEKEKKKCQRVFTRSYTPMRGHYTDAGLSRACTCEDRLSGVHD